MNEGEMNEKKRQEKLAELLAILEPLSAADRYRLLKCAWVFYGLIGLGDGA